jgi:hypothetical protein
MVRFYIVQTGKSINLERTVRPALIEIDNTQLAFSLKTRETKAFGL